LFDFLAKLIGSALSERAIEACQRTIFCEMLLKRGYAPAVSSRRSVTSAHLCGEFWMART